MLIRIYQHFLEDEESASFIRRVSDHYTISTLKKLFFCGDRPVRRAAILAIGYLGDFTQNETMGRALVDTDRAVRLLAEHNIRQIWLRQGTPGEQQLLLQLENLNATVQSENALKLASQLIKSNRTLGEAWNQRAIAFSAAGNPDQSIQDCREVLNCNRFHFPAAIGMGQGYLQLDDVFKALDCFRIALKINPDLECLRGQIRRLERMLDDR